MDGVILIAIVIPAIMGIFFMFHNILTNDGGTKGIEKEPYYGRKTGTIYTAKKDRERYIV